MRDKVYRFDEASFDFQKYFENLNTQFIKQRRQILSNVIENTYGQPNDDLIHEIEQFLPQNEMTKFVQKKLMKIEIKKFINYLYSFTRGGANLLALQHYQENNTHKNFILTQELWDKQYLNLIFQRFVLCYLILLFPFNFVIMILTSSIQSVMSHLLLSIYSYRHCFEKKLPCTLLCRLSLWITFFPFVFFIGILICLFEIIFLLPVMVFIDYCIIIRKWYSLDFRKYSGNLYDVKMGQSMIKDELIVVHL